MKKRMIGLFIIMLILICTLTGCNLEDVKNAKEIIAEKAENNSSINIDVYNQDKSALNSTEDINLRDLDGKKTNYAFTYKNTEFSAKYTKDNWHITDSYKITNEKDLEIICQALIEIHPIHGKDMTSYREVDDLVYEWMQHNLMYSILPEDNAWKNNAKDVDLDPADQGRTLDEMYEARTGKKLDMLNKSNINKIKEEFLK